MTYPTPDSSITRNWQYFRAGLLGVIPIALFGILLLQIFIQTNMFVYSAFFQDTTATFDAILYVSIATWTVAMAIANGRRLEKKRGAVATRA